MLKKLYKRFLDLSFPRHCIKCNKLNPVSEYEYICQDCAKTIYEEKQSRCLKCGEFIYFKDDLKSCPKCFDTKFFFEGNLCPVVYRDLNASLVKDLKYHKALYLLKDMAKICIDSPNFLEYIKDAIFVPVPLHKNRFKQRSFNQSEKIAKAISAQTKNLVIENLLLRTKDTLTQTHLDSEMRKANIKNAFAFNPKYSDLAKDSKIIIIDDVMTTGATLNECAKTLYKNKFRDIRSLSFAKRPLI